MKRRQYIWLFAVLTISFNVFSEAHKQDETVQKAILVTGANSGLGLRMTLVLV